jgi:hypothetical protein
MNNEHNLDAVYSPDYLNKGIPISTIAILEIFLGSFVLHSSLAERDMLGLLSGVLLIAMGMGLFYFARPLANKKRILSSLLIREDRLVFDDKIDGIQTIYWNSVVSVQLAEEGRSFLRKIIVQYHDITCGVVKNESGCDVSEVKSLEIPLVVFNKAEKIISCIQLITKEQGIPFARAFE